MKAIKVVGLFFVSWFICELFSASPAFADLRIIDILRQATLGDVNTQPSKDTHKKWSMRFCKGTGSIKTKRKVVALTFDDGPHKKYTDEILLILNEHEIKATFFFVGKNVEENEELVKAVFESGHVIGNHSYSHSYLTDLSSDEIEEELSKTDSLIERIIGVFPVIFRPPYGSCSPKTTKIAKELGYKTILWNVDYRLTDNASAEEFAYGIMGQVKPGSIIILHDGGGNREKIVEALPIIIHGLKKQGYVFLTVPQLLNIDEYR